MSDTIDSTNASQKVSASTPEVGPPPPAALLQMMTGYWISKAIYVAAKLGVADLVAEGPRTADELAAATQTNADALYRVLRALASVGIFSEVDPSRFALTPWPHCCAATPPTRCARSRSCTPRSNIARGAMSSTVYAPVSLRLSTPSARAISTTSHASRGESGIQ